MKVGDLVRYLRTDTFQIVTFFDELTGECQLWGWGDYCFGPLTHIEIVNERR